MPEPNETLAAAERRIDAMNAELRADFQKAFGDPEEMLAQLSLKPVLDALSPDYSMWQRAFWLVSPDEWLDGECPIDAVCAGKIDRVIEAARLTHEDPIG